MKKYSILLTLILILVLLCSCGKNNVVVQSDVSDLQQTETASTGEVTQQDYFYSTTIENDLKSAVNKSQDDKSENTTLQSNAIQREEPSSNTNVELPVQNQGQNDKQCSVTISVNCRNAIDYGILEESTFASVLPADGVILPNVSFDIKDGDNVAKVLKSALKSHNITYSVTSSGYVRAIGGLSEFDCGETSGWLYRVNGNLPYVSTKSYYLHDGDTVELIYTCVQGDV